MKKKAWVILGIAALCASPGTSRADGIGLTVTGVLTLFGPGQVALEPPVGATNFLNSAFGAVPAGYGDSGTAGTAVIGSGIEFGVTNGSDLLTVDYTGTTVTVTDTCVGAGCGATAYTLALYSPYITGYSVLSYNFPDTILGYGDTLYFPGNAGALTFLGQPSGFTGGSITLSYTSVAPPPVAPAFRSFAALAAPAAVPEPASIGLLATGLLGAAAFVRNRFRGL
jgi:hypothetical protein